MSSSDSSDLRRLRGGERQAAQALWERYFRRLAGLARRILEHAPRRMADEEDVALSALDSLCRGVERGQFPDLDSKGLWRLLVVITRRKAFDLVKAQGRLKNGGGHVVGESALAGRSSDDLEPGAGLDDLPGPEPTPDFLAAAAEEYRQLLRALGDPELQEIARQKMEGYTNEEIASLHRCSLARIERKLRLIRATWRRLS